MIPTIDIGNGEVTKVVLEILISRFKILSSRLNEWILIRSYSGYITSYSKQHIIVLYYSV